MGVLVIIIFASKQLKQSLVVTEQVEQGNKHYWQDPLINTYPLSQVQTPPLAVILDGAQAVQFAGEVQAEQGKGQIVQVPEFS